jgi:hypothetical protein
VTDDRRSGDRPDRPARSRPSGAASSRGGRGGSRSRDGQQEGSRPATARRDEPALPDEVTGSELDRAVRAELSSLATLNSTAVSRHLVMAGRLLDEDPELAYRHAIAARDRAGRVGAVREAAGIAAYVTGRYAEALAELRAARRMSGDQSTLPMMADCERGLGRPAKALELAGSPDVAKLDAAGREYEAVTCSEHAAEADETGETDADERLAELGGVTIVEHDDD